MKSPTKGGPQQHTAILEKFGVDRGKLVERAAKDELSKPLTCFLCPCHVNSNFGQ